MFSAELRVNGALIGHVYGQNKNYHGGGLYKYEYHYYSVERNDIHIGELLHDRFDGLETLIAKILADIITSKKLSKTKKDKH